MLPTYCLKRTIPHYRFVYLLHSLYYTLKITDMSSCEIAYTFWIFKYISEAPIYRNDNLQILMYMYMYMYIHSAIWVPVWHFFIN